MVRVVAVRVAAVLLTGVGLAGAHTLRSSVPQPAEEVRLARVPNRIGPWRGRDVEVPLAILEMLRPDAYLLREYTREGSPPVLLFVDYHRVQRLGAQIHSPRVCYPGAGWDPQEVEVSDLGGEGERSPACWLRLRQDGRERVAVYWYESRWGRSAREMGLKWGIVRSTFARRPSDAALVRLSTPRAPGESEEAARERLRRFAGAVEESLRRELPFRRPR